MVDAWVGEVQRCCETAAAGGRSVVLDMRNVSFADAAGVALLQTLHLQGVCLNNCSSFIAAQIGLEEKESRSC
jgi:hypothetical protein